MNSNASGVLLTGKSRTKVGRTPYLSKIRCARSWHLTEVTPLARRGRAASQSNSASVSTTTTSIGFCSAGQWIVLQVLGSSMLNSMVQQLAAASTAAVPDPGGGRIGERAEGFEKTHDG